MSFDFIDRRNAERFAELLDSTSGGRRHHSRGQADEQLAELVAIGHGLSAVHTPAQVDPEFRVGLRAMLVATAERDGIGRTAGETESEPAGVPAREPARGLFGRGAGRRIRARGAIVIGVAAGAMAVSGISAASENASPGDALYGVKRSTEKAQLAMAGSDVTRGQLSLDFARKRLREAVAMRGDDPAFPRVLDDMDSDTRQGVRLLNDSAVTRRDTAPLTTVDTFVAAQRRTLERAVGELGAGNRARAQESLTLLDNAHGRADDLRAGLACDTVTPAGTDSLGQRLGDCGTAPDGTSQPQRPQATAPTAGTRSSPGPARSGPDKVRPQRTDPADVPDATGRATAPATTRDGRSDSGATTTTTTKEPAATDAAPTATADATSPAPDTAPADRDKTTTDEEHGLLDGILSGIFGG